MLKTESAIGSLLIPSELNHWLTNKTLVLSSRQMDWNGILIEQYQNSLNPGEVELPVLSNHWLKLPLGQPGRLTQKSDDRLYESTNRREELISTASACCVKFLP